MRPLYALVWYAMLVLRNARQCKAWCAGLFAFWAFYRTAGLVTALLVSSTNVALVRFIGYVHAMCSQNCKKCLALSQ